MGAFPPSGSADGFASVPGVQVTESATASANIVLGPAASAHVSGNAYYADRAPDAGVDVSVDEEIYGAGGASHQLRTDEAGNWDAGVLPDGFYRVFYSVSRITGAGLAATQQSLGDELIVVEGADVFLAKELSGPRPGATVEGTVMAAEGWPSRAFELQVSQVGGGISGAADVAQGHFRITGLPAGTYQLSASGEEDEDDATGTTTVSVTEGRVFSATVQLAARSTPSGITASHEQEDLGLLNAQRARWGLPAGLVAVPLWSQACAAHDSYMAQNHVLEHPEHPAPGHSEAGQWAGEHAVLDSGGGWSETTNPFMDAPYHLEQLFAPGLLDVGIDESQGYGCVTTWPGMRRTPAAAGTVYTFPGNGTAGVSPVESAAEFPSTPNEDLGLPAKTGRQLIVWEEDGDPLYRGSTDLTGASLSSVSGSVEVKWVSGSLGAIIIPVQPLAPFTTYTATVSLAETAPFSADVAPTGPETYSWSFTTGEENPGGGWEEPGIPIPTGPSRPMKVHAAWAHGHMLVKGWGFEPGAVAVHVRTRKKAGRRGRRKARNRKGVGRILASATARPSGRFIARFRWPKARRLAMLVVQGKHGLPVNYAPRVRVRHHVRKHHGRRHHRRNRHHAKRKPRK